MTWDTNLPLWMRLQAASPQALHDLGRDHGLDLLPTTAPSQRGAGAAMRIRCARVQDGRVLLADMLWHQSADAKPLYTVETGQRMLRPGQAQQRFQAQGLPAGSAHAVALVLLHQLLGQTGLVLDRIDAGLTTTMRSLRSFQLTVGTPGTRGAEDLTDVDSDLAMLNRPLSVVLEALDDLAQAARQLRRSVLQGSQLERSHVDALLAEIDSVQRRGRFMLERQRFQRQAAEETVAMSDLNVTKVFSVLWAAFIPGTALINWYGQNFRVMPELSWPGSLWMQLLAVLVLTAIPVWMVKQSGTLR
ncbi:CorA family divalent cation transporter [Comamonas sp. JUb58]|uniref:CorA family divalent cation transporter n=1 Tax=Comamonas sp. JUb58 TaxID=2485114 RepID=UPI001060B7B2|nr:CorA family divalent cation transporter [Comamonas sp. JUb58]TDS68803.1 Mg2+ and Co2+ transporter CorA [Comamonas sp. JUb58]